MTAPPTPEEAIRLVISDGVKGDFFDVVNAVKDRFRIQVGTGQVEQVYREIKQEAEAAGAGTPETDPSQSRSELRSAKIQFVSKHVEDVPGNPIRQSGPMTSEAETDSSRRSEVLKFVELMGGFQSARNAINDVEASLRQLIEP